MTISAVIPNWNGRHHLERLLPTLNNQTLPPLEIIVVDNGSTDGSVAYARDQGLTVIAIASNRGFAFAVNRGVEQSQGEGILVLNNDVELDSRCLELLGQAVASGSWFAVPRLMRRHESGVLDGAFDAVCRGGTAWRCGAGRPAAAAAWNQGRTARFAPLTAALFRAELFRRAGLLDELFETYLEDVDFGLRTGSQGYTGVYLPDAIAVHAGSATRGPWHPRTVSQIARNQLLLVSRHYPKGFLWRYGWPIAVAQLLWGLVALRHGAGLAWLKGKIDGLRLFRSARRPGTEGLARLLASSERELYELQQDTGFDWYWRAYFALVRPPADRSDAG